jgi:hypothetical protein
MLEDTGKVKVVRVKYTLKGKNTCKTSVQGVKRHSIKLGKISILEEVGEGGFRTIT